MPSISLCMIVRDEAAMLPEFLDHARGCYDQLVAFDTGSRDGTVDLLRAAGAEVHEGQWRDDFAWARNESLRHATGDWILVLDADEFPHAGFRDELRAFTAQEEVGAATLCRHDDQRNGITRISRPLRLFRRAPDIRYRYRIHEDATDAVLAMLTATGKRLGELSTPVRHLGYTPDRLLATNKRARDERILKLALDDDPDDLYSRYKLLEQYRFWSDPAGAKAVAAECLALLERGVAVRPPHIAGDLVDMMRQALCGDRAAEGIAFMERMEGVAGTTGRYRFSLGMLCETAGQAARAFENYVAALDLLAADPERLLIETRVLCGLARLSLSIGDVDAAREFAQAAGAIAPEDAEVQVLTGAL